MKIIAVSIYIFLLGSGIVKAQSIKATVSQDVDTLKTYVFYLHGAIEINQGKGISSHYGVYEYQQILDTLASYGYKVISEARPIDADQSKYAAKIARQIDTLLEAGVKPACIHLVGASAGAYIIIEVALQMKNPNINYAILGMCRPDTYQTYKGKVLCGNFLSIYEASDPHGSCLKVIEDKRCKTGMEEIELNMNNSHGFLYKPYKEWVHPLVKWIDKKP